MIYADQRWIGEHGIGRFARQVLARIDYRPLTLDSNPAAPLDPWRLAGALRHLGRGDLFYSPGYNAPLFCRAPFVITIHDLNHLDRPENSSALKRLYYATLLRRAVHRAQRVLTVSEFSRGRILDWSGVSAGKVVIVGNGVGAEFHPDVEPMRLSQPYLLCATSRKRHKNDFRVVEAFARAKLEGMLLVFTGETETALSACIQRHRLNGKVQFTGLVSSEKMPSLYRGAEAVVFASLYEGFGLPVVEAMACGTPVVTSITSALPEVAGDAALLVDPTSVEQITRAMERIVGDSGLRQILRARGLARAARYSWADTAARVQQVLDEAMPQPLAEIA
jgi:glycosyltransferase involved in cell wall biosynthesis